MEFVDRKVTPSWMWLDGGERYRLAALCAGFVHERSKDIVGVPQLAQGLAHEGVGAGSVCTPHSKMHLMVARRTFVNADMRVIFFRQ
jgi:hypothetical protein